MKKFKIREFRKAKGLYQDEFATIIGLTQSNLSRYETNDIDLNETQMKILIDKYGEDEINKYMVSNPNDTNQILINENDLNENASVADLLSIIKKQNDALCKQMEMQDTFSQQIISFNERLLSMLEKVSLG